MEVILANILNVQNRLIFFFFSNVIVSKEIVSLERHFTDVEDKKDDVFLNN